MAGLAIVVGNGIATLIPAKHDPYGIAGTDTSDIADIFARVSRAVSRELWITGCPDQAILDDLAVVGTTLERRFIARDAALLVFSK